VKGRHVAIADIHWLNDSIDAGLFALSVAIWLNDATQVVIDSLPAFELALVPTFRADFRTMLMISELEKA